MLFRTLHESQREDLSLWALGVAWHRHCYSHPPGLTCLSLTIHPSHFILLYHVSAGVGMFLLFCCDTPCHVSLRYIFLLHSNDTFILWMYVHALLVIDRTGYDMIWERGTGCAFSSGGEKNKMVCLGVGLGCWDDGMNGWVVVGIGGHD